MREAKTQIAIHSLDEVALLLTERLLMTLEGLGAVGQEQDRWREGWVGVYIEKEGGLGIQFDHVLTNTFLPLACYPAVQKMASEQRCAHAVALLLIGRTARAAQSTTICAQDSQFFKVQLRFNLKIKTHRPAHPPQFCLKLKTSCIEPPPSGGPHTAQQQFVRKAPSLTPASYSLIPAQVSILVII